MDVAPRACETASLARSTGPRDLCMLPRPGEPDDDVLAPLPAAVAADDDAATREWCVHAAAASVVGERHEVSEDRYVLEPDLLGDRSVAFFGVYDGHGGASAADYACDRLHRAVAERLRAAQWTASAKENEMHDLLSACILQAERDFCGWAERQRPPDYSGTCAVCVLVDRHRRQVHVANTGDSKAAMFEFQLHAEPQRCRRASIDLSRPHTAADATERARICAVAGPSVFGPRCGTVLGLEPSRTIGDIDVKSLTDLPVVIAQPEMLSRALDPVCCTVLIVASDGASACGRRSRCAGSFIVSAPPPPRAMTLSGMWDVLTTEEASDLVLHTVRGAMALGFPLPVAVQQAADALVEQAIDRGSDDDITAVVAAVVPSQARPV